LSKRERLTATTSTQESPQLKRGALSILDDVVIAVSSTARFPPEPFRSVGTAVIRRAIIAKDTAEEQGRKPNLLTAAIAHLPRRMGYLLDPEPKPGG
jgi:hypothetical protein